MKTMESKTASVCLRAIDSPELIQIVATWLSEKENYQWLQFGDGKQLVTPQLLKILIQRDTHLLRVYFSEDGVPLGVVGLEEINPNFRTARIWVVAGAKAVCGRGYATQAVSKMLTLAFQDLGLQAVNTWIVEHNPSVHVAGHVNFKFIGRQRQCHSIDGKVYDRLLFDILACEHKED